MGMEPRDPRLGQFLVVLGGSKESSAERILARYAPDRGHGGLEYA